MRIVVFGLLMLSAQVAMASSVTVTVDDTSGCNESVHVLATDAPLSQLFTALAESLDFELIFKGTDRRVNLDLDAHPAELIRSVTRGENVMISTVADADCDDGRRISKVRFLATGDPIVYQPVRQRAATAPAPPAAAGRADVNQNTDWDSGPRGRRRGMTPEERLLDRYRQRNRGNR